MSFYGGNFYGGKFLDGGGILGGSFHSGASVGPFFGGPFFSGGFFGELQDEEVPKTGGKGDNKKRRKTIYKPTGLPPYRKPVEQRVAETHEIAKEVVRSYQDVPVVPVVRMSLAEVQEIGMLIRKQDD